MRKYVLGIIILISINSFAQTNSESHSLVQLVERIVQACEGNDTILVEELLEKAVSDYKSYSGEEQEEIKIANIIIGAYLWENNGKIKKEWFVSSLNKDTAILTDLYQLKQNLEQTGLDFSILHLATVSKICDIYRNTNQNLSVISLLRDMLSDNTRDDIVNNIVFRILYSTLGASYHAIGDYDVWKMCVSISKTLFEVANDVSSPTYAAILQQLAAAYDMTNEPLMAKLYEEEAIYIYESLGQDVWECNNVQCVDLLNTLGCIYENLEDYELADEVYSKLLNSPILDSINQDIVSCAFMNAALLRFLVGDYSGCIERMKRIDYTQLSPMLRIKYMSTLSLSEYLSNDQRYYDHLTQYNELAKDYILGLYTKLSRKDRERIWTTQSKSMNSRNYLVLQKNDAKTVANAYNNALFTKNMLLRSSQIEDAICSSCTSPYVKDLLNRKAAIKKELKNEGVLSIDEFMELSSALISVEQEIYKNIPDFKTQIANSFNTWEIVRSSLNDGELAIEFIAINGRQGPKVVADSIGALILSSSSSSPEYVKLCSSDELNKYLDAASTDSKINKIYSTDNEGTNKLYKMIWEPLAPILAKYKTIYYSPVSALNRINHAAIPYGKTQTMGDHWNMIMVSCTDNIRRDNRIELDSCAVFGAVNYEGCEDSLRSKALAYNVYRGCGSNEIFKGNDRGRYWGPLQGTKEEADGICSMLRDNGVPCKPYEGLDALEEVVKAMDGESPSVLHFATHGFYITNPEEKENTPFFNRTFSGTAEDNSMKCSGILLAGGQISWMRGKSYEGLEDGILTAEEIALLDFHTTDLVVLSACETALGDNNSVDGVFGLQRALKKAGVNTIIMTLWPVKDEATKELMLTFYDNLLKSKDKRSAFNAAIQSIRAKYQSPSYWAGFVMLD